MSASPAPCEVCRKPVPLASQCSGCHSVSYCGKEHQKQDWPKHRGTCRAYKVKLSQTGHYVAAARNIKKGEVIVNEEPMVIGPRYFSALATSCVGCFFAEMQVRCPQCDWPMCSLDCPGLAIHHKTECPIFTKLKPSLIGQFQEAILPLRCYLLQKNDPQKWKVLEEMALSNLPEVQGKEQCSQETRIFLEEAILRPLNKIAPEMLAGCSPEKIPLVFNLLYRYSLFLKLPHTGELRGVCTVSSYMEHSCLPNTRRILDIPHFELQPGIPYRCRVIIRAAKNIRKGEHITTMVIDSQSSTLERQKTLMTNRGVLCKCARCLDPRELGADTGTMKCTKCDGWVLPVDTSNILESDWKCQGKCQKVYPRMYILTTLNTLREKLAILEDHAREKRKIREELEMFLTRLSKLLHPNHCSLISAKKLLFVVLAGSGRGSVLKTLNFLSGSSDDELRRFAEVCKQYAIHMKHPVYLESPLACLDENLRLLYVIKHEMASRLFLSGNLLQFDTVEYEKAVIHCEALIALNAQYDQPIIPIVTINAITGN